MRSIVVYVVETGHYEARSVRGVYGTLEEAKASLANVRGSWIQDEDGYWTKGVLHESTLGRWLDVSGTIDAYTVDLSAEGLQCRAESVPSPPEV